MGARADVLEPKELRGWVTEEVERMGRAI